MFKTVWIASIALLIAGTMRAQAEQNPIVEIVTSLGTLKVELYPEKAPVTVSNFLAYVDSGFYEGTIFHRVIRNFMIQGGGFDADMHQKPTQPPIRNEAANGLRNTRGTIAMARTMIPDSATSQFYINTGNNRALDYRNNTLQGIGYCVFGRLLEGQDVLDTIQSVPTGSSKGMADVPLEPVLIQRISRVTPATETNE
ncbi:MAG: peptidylprolyl isomerase [Kiritimatiellia bacterium]